MYEPSLFRSVCASTVDHRGNYPVPTSVSFDTRRHEPDAVMKVLVQMEPREVLCEDLLQGAGDFDLVLAWDEAFLKLPNAELFPFGQCWIDWETFVPDKGDMVSFLTSDKTLTAGHALRQCIWEDMKPWETLYGADDYPFDLMAHRSPPWAPSKNPFYESAKFSIVVENVRQKNWFTEKIIDCFATQTVPIYWGCPNIGEFFNERGILTFDSEDGLLDVLGKLSPEDYDERFDVMQDNYNRSRDYWGFHGRIRKRILERIPKLAA